MASSLTYCEGMSKLQLAFVHCFNRPGKPKGGLCEMSLRDMLAEVNVVEEAEVVAIGTMIGKMAQRTVWKAAMMRFEVEFPSHKHGPASRKIAFRYWRMPDVLLDLVPLDWLHSRIVAEKVDSSSAAATMPAVDPAPPPLPSAPAEEEKEVMEVEEDGHHDEDNDEERDTSNFTTPLLATKKMSCVSIMSSNGNSSAPLYCQGISKKSFFLENMRTTV